MYWEPAGLQAFRDTSGTVFDDLRSATAQLLDVSARLSSLARENPDPSVSAHLATAMDALGASVTALFASVDIKCTLAEPPSEVDTRPRGPDNEMVTKCFHEPAHCWSGAGKYVVCP